MFDGTKFDITFIKFSDGAEICKLPELPSWKNFPYLNLVLNVENCNQDLIRLMLVKDALDSSGIEDVELTMNYIPNARADRRFSRNQSHSLKVFCSVINSLNFNRVNVSDPHSDVSATLLDNVFVKDQVNCFMQIKNRIDKVSSDYVLCSPDLGATKKTFDLAMKLKGKGLIQAVKIRDISNGNIIKCDVLCDNLNGKDIVIVDDIADGGASFLYLSKKLKEKGAGKVILYVTHGIFSKGLHSLIGNIDYIFVYNLMQKYINIKDIELFNNKTGN